MRTLSKEYIQAQMALVDVKTRLKHVNFLSKDWQELDKEETRIINYIKGL